MTFEEYLVKKRINKAAFEADDHARFTAWQQMYAQMHPNSFYMAVKMVINDVRLRFHLKEEDVPKAAPVITVPKPVVRRAPTPAEAAPAAQQETEEKKPAVFKPRPVVKRPATLLPPAPAEDEVKTVGNSPEVKPEEVKPEQSTTVETEKPSAKPRPVIKRPVISRPATADADETAPAAKPPTGEAAAANEDKPVRPRPVIKRPAALQKPGTADTAKPETTAPESINPASAEQPAQAPPRPRPVIKRPAALQKRTEEEPTESISASESIKPVEDEPIPAASTEPAAPVQDEQKPKPPRPRPVIKRPTPAADSALAKVITKDPTQPATERAGEPETPKQAEPTGEELKPKPPRLRPIIKRPPPKTDGDNAEAGS